MVLNTVCCVVCCLPAATGTGKDDRITAESRVTITPLLIRAASSNSGSTPKPAAVAQAAAGEDADGSQEPAAKKPRHEEAAAAASDAPNSTPAAAGAGAVATGRGMASVHSSAGVQSAVACYVCQLATIPGKLDPQKAAQLGVPRGPVSAWPVFCDCVVTCLCSVVECLACVLCLCSGATVCLSCCAVTACACGW